MDDESARQPLHHDVNFEIRPGSYEVWFSDRIAESHTTLVDEFADWLENEVGVVNLGQIDHRCLLADGVLGDELKVDIVGWWLARLMDLNQGTEPWTR